MELRSIPGFDKEMLTTTKELVSTSDSATTTTYQTQSTTLPAVCSTTMVSQTKELATTISTLLGSHGIFQTQAPPAPSSGMTIQEILGNTIEN